MDWLSLDSLKALLAASWGFLITLSLAFTALWLAPDDWLLDASVAAVRNQYKGQIGFLAIVFVLLLGSRMVVATPAYIRFLANRLLDVYSQRREQHNYRTKILKRLSRLEEPERNLLFDMFNSRQRILALPSNDPHLTKLFNAGFITFREHEAGMSTFEIHKWVWKELPARLHALYRNDGTNNAELISKSNQSPSPVAKS
jgi:hypothetical protein